MTELIFLILDQPHAPLRTLRPDLPDGLGATIDRCVAKDPAQRFRNIAELAHALAPYGPEWAKTSAVRSAHVLGVGVDLAVTQPPNLDAALPAYTAGPLPIAVELGPDPAVTNAPWSQSSHDAPAPALRDSRQPRRLLMPLALVTLAAGVSVGGILLTQLSDRGETTSQRPVSELPPLVVASGGLPARTSETAREPMLAPPPLPASMPVAAAPPSLAEPSASPPPTLAEPSASPPPTATALSPATPPSAARPPAQAVVRPVKPIAQVSPKASAVPSAAPPRCSTVTYFDADGMKHFKQECRCPFARGS